MKTYCVGAVCKCNDGWSNVSEHNDGGGSVYKDGGGGVWAYNNGTNNNKTMYTYAHLTTLHSTACIALHIIYKNITLLIRKLSCTNLCVNAHLSIDIFQK